jgi:hypothetical protein
MKKCVACAEDIQKAASLCRHCGTMQNDERFASHPSGQPAQKPAARDGYAVSEFEDSKEVLARFWNAVKEERSLQIAIAYTLLTFFDSLFWLSWSDPFTALSPDIAALLGFRNFYEWFLPTLASVLLFLAWNKGEERYFTWAVWAGGFATLGLDLLLNLALGINFLGLFDFGDFVDLTATIGLVTLFFLQRSGESNGR